MTDVKPILDLDLPGDPIRALLYLSGVHDAVARELDQQWRRAYFEARLTGRIDQALALHLHARKRVLAYTRAENERRGRVIRSWGDGY